MKNPNRPMQIFLIAAGVVVLAVAGWGWRESGAPGAGIAVGLILILSGAIIGNRARRPRGDRPDQP